MPVITNIDEIRSVPVEEVIERFLPLKRQGTRLVACCPFHNERTPSFGVQPGRGHYKCFGCGAAGDGLKFLQEAQNMTFLEAVEWIATNFRIELKRDKSVDYDAEKKRQEEERQERESIHLLQQWAAKTYFAATFGDDSSFNYDQVAIDGRRLSWRTIRDFELSYTGDGNLIRVESTKEGWGMELLLKTNLLKEGKEGSGTYDGFYRRFLFPIRDQRGKLAGFAGRRLKEEDRDNKRPKYVNSPEHALYKKSETLYGLWQNKKKISAERVDYARNEGFAYIVEGYMDVLTMYDHGIGNAVAPCGTALTDDQIELLSHYTSEVVLCFDSDNAGASATSKSIERLLKKGFKVSVLFLPNAGGEKHDPDSFLREFGISRPVHAVNPETGLATLKVADHGWAGRMRRHRLNAIEYLVLNGYDPKDPHSREVSIKTAGRLLSYIDSAILVNSYIDELCQKGKLGNVKKDIREALGEERGKYLTNNRHKFSLEQQQDRLRYGIYKDNNKFWQAIGDGEGYELTNFVVEPLMCVIGSNKSLRLVRIVNEDGMTATIEMDSDDIVELSTFKKVVARKGNFVFKASCKAEHFARIQAKIMAETPNVYPIYTMGLHKMPDETTFYAFANGIFTEEGFHPVDDYGACKIKDVTYYLPAFSKVRIGGLGEQATESFEDIKSFIFLKDAEAPDFRDWTDRMRKVYGRNGIIGVAYYLAAVHRDIIHKRFSMFPHLNLFGVPQSGKNQLAGSLTAMFGLPQPPIGLENATRVAMTRLISVIRNGIVWFDEYKNDVDRWVVELLKGFADGTSRRKGDANMENRTISTPVNSAAIVSGQHQLTLDIAMFSRTISLNFDKTEFSDEQRTNLRDLKDMEDSGVLSQLTTQIHGYRDLFLEKFNSSFEAVRTDFSASFPEGTVISDRVLNMFCIPLTAFQLLADKLQFAFGYDELKSALLGNIMTQKESMFAENEVSIFWRIIEFFLERRELKHGHDLIVEYQTYENFDEDWSGKKQRRVEYADSQGNGQRKLVYLYFGVAHPLYMKQHLDERRVKGLDKQALFLYLKSSDAFEGLKRAKKFSGKPKSCMVFDADKLPFEIQLTIEVFAREARAKGLAEHPDNDLIQSTNCDTCKRTHEHCTCKQKEDIPF
jgi:DNA primase